MKKNNMERKVLKEIFNKNERNVIFNALCYSCQRYKKQGRIDEAVKVQSVINHVYDAFGIANLKYTKEEVDKIVDNAMEHSVRKVKEYFSGKIDEAHKAGYEAALKDVSAGLVSIIGYKENNEEAADNDGEEKPNEPAASEEKPAEETEHKGKE